MCFAVGKSIIRCTCGSPQGPLAVVFVSVFSVSCKHHSLSSLVWVDLGNLEGQERKSPTETSDLSEAEWGLLFTVQVGVLHTKDVLEVVWI